MSWTPEEAERVKALEVHQAEQRGMHTEMNEKLDELLALKHKGLGAFWLASIIIGAAFTAALSLFSNFFRGS